jgi:hypothetical protein
LKFTSRFLGCWFATVLVTSGLGWFSDGLHGAFVWLGPGFLIGAPLSWVMVKLNDRFGHMASELYAGVGGVAQVGYSLEKTQARQGDREGACEALLLRGNAGDNGALHALISIASERPMLGAWVVKAAQIILRQEKLGPGDKEHFTKLIKEYSN